VHRIAHRSIRFPSRYGRNSPGKGLCALFLPYFHVGIRRALITSDPPGESEILAAWNVKEMMQEKMKVLSTIVERTGIASVFRRAIAGRSGLILALHRVLPTEEQCLCYNPHLVLTESAFVSLLQLLQRDYHVVPLEDVLTHPRGAEGHPKVAITFDDGWEDNYRVAFPHLVRFDMPATIFACTGLLDTLQLLPEERFARLWSQCSARSTLEELVIDLNHWGMGRSKNRQLRPRQQYWSRELKRMPLSARLLLLDHLEQRYQMTVAQTRRFLTWEQVRVMTRTGLIRIGSHTHRHATLSSESDRDIRQELEDARISLWQHAGAVSEVLAYPNGMYNRRVQDLVRSMGFKAALSTIPGFFTRESNPLAIPRIAVDNTTVTDAGLQLSASRASFYFLSSGLRSAASF
jgi:peptidoglycan/xylan/chitin deacetylase (PgdA/CDA1 family)